MREEAGIYTLLISFSDILYGDMKLSPLPYFALGDSSGDCVRTGATLDGILPSCTKTQLRNLYQRYGFITFFSATPHCCSLLLLVVGMVLVATTSIDLLTAELLQIT